MNASDERGIGVIREKVKKFAQLMCVKNNDKTYLCPTFKIIILDEADLLTQDAQSALRRVIEDNSSTTRFCIICNYVTKYSLFHVESLSLYLQDVLSSDSSRFLLRHKCKNSKKYAKMNKSKYKKDSFLHFLKREI